LCGTSVLAAESQEDLFIKQGIERRRLDDDAGALELFTKAYELHHAPRALAQIGLARMALGLWVQAEADLEGALAATDDPWIRKNTGCSIRPWRKFWSTSGGWRS
jgi:tetratricopeptide (TPR) repeat protein